MPKPLDDALCSDLEVAQRAPSCVLISAPRDAAWDTARKIACGCGAGLNPIDCDTVDPNEMAGVLRERISANSRGAVEPLVFLREVQTLSLSNQRLLDDLICAQAPAANRPRLIASSSLSLYEWTRTGRFDEGLFYKLNAVHLRP